MAVTLGCALFPLTGRVAAKVAADGPSTSATGVLLMLNYLAFDGFTSTWQARSPPRDPCTACQAGPSTGGPKALEPSRLKERTLSPATRNMDWCQNPRQWGQLIYPTP